MILTINQNLDVIYIYVCAIKRKNISDNFIFENIRNFVYVVIIDEPP